MRYSKAYATFNSELEHIISYSTANQKRLQITDAVLQILKDDWTLWQSHYEPYLDPGRRTPLVSQSVKTAYHDIDAYLRRFKQSVKMNVNITLTDSDYGNLYIHKDKTARRHHKAPEYAPVINLLSSEHLLNEFELLDSRPGAEHRRHFPIDVVYAGRKLALVSADAPPPADTDYRTLTQTSRVIFNLHFSPADEGKKGYLITWYVNERGEVGPQSKPVSFYVN